MPDLLQPVRPVRLLIVEDEFLIAMMAEDVLIAAGFDVVGVARSYEEALVLGEQEHPDLALMDIRLATDRDGVEAAVALRQQLNIASLFTSANHDPHTMQRAAPAAPAGWLAKPYTPDGIVEAIRAAVEDLELTRLS